MKIKTIKIFNFLIILFLLKPTGLDGLFPNLNFIMNIFRFLSMLLILIIYLKKIKDNKIKVSNCICIVALIEIFSIFCCLYNNQPCHNVIVYWQSIISLMMLAEVQSKNMIELIHSVTTVLGIYLIINLIYILCIYKTINNNTIFILGKKNMLILYVFPFIFLESFLNIIKENGKKGFGRLILIIISLFTIFVSSSATSTFACMILFVYYIFQNNKIINKILMHISAKQILFIMAAFFVLIVIYNVQKYFSFIIVDTLGKDLTFTGRTYIWNKAIDLILKNPFGYGWEAEVPDVITILDWVQYSNVGHAHNFILNLAYKSGIIVSIFYCILLGQMSKKIDSCNNIKLQGLMKITYVVFLILTTFEAYPTNCICLFFICYVMMNYKLIIKESDDLK